MVTAKEYRELSVEYYRLADEAETEEVRDTYLRLARQWTLAPLNANVALASSCGHSFVHHYSAVTGASHRVRMIQKHIRLNRQP
jgi:hypothetical protein